MDAPPTPSSIRAAIAAATVVCVGALVILGAAAAHGRWSTVAWTALAATGALALARGLSRRRRGAWLSGLAVAWVGTAFFGLLVAVKLALLPAEARGEPLELAALLAAAAPFAVAAFALARRSARAWFRPIG